MNRSLTRQILRAARQTPDSAEPFRHLVEVDLFFGEAAFADAPEPWSPGAGFVEVMGGAWLRGNADGTQTAVVAGVGPKELPAADGGPWTEEEVWTVTSADPDVFAYLDDKPHRVTWAFGRLDVEIVREPYATHPQAAVDAYWEKFYRKWWFLPELREDGRHSVTLGCAPNDSWEHGPWPLARACGRLMSALGGRATVRRTVNPDAHRSVVPQCVTQMRSIPLA
ncbi:hypothetical protein ACFYZ8_33270 [Streptomyces sp. NPDC001668]|uniref:hypothetical protein n=1 Tax=Streptomyces sp. NPDC001668 TaxID=3364598 RepID=UPI0036CD5D13